MTRTHYQTECEGYIIWYGRNAVGNTQLIKDADPSDLWFHVDDHASAHVICEPKNPQTPFPSAVVQFCANLCVERTPNLARQGLTKVDVMYTYVSNLKLGKSPGEVDVVDESLVRRIRVKVPVVSMSSPITS